MMIHNHIKTLFNIPNLKPDSPWALRNLVDLLSRNIRSLETKGVKTESWDPLIIYLVSSKMDQDTISQWEQCNIQGDLPSYSELKSFLIARADLIEKISSHKSNSKSKVPEKNIQVKKDEKCFLSNKISHVQAKNKERSIQHYKFSCYFCSKPHSIYSCDEFRSLSLQEKLEKVRSLKLCSNCLQKGHEVANCKYGSCKHC